MIVVIIVNIAAAIFSGIHFGRFFRKLEKALEIANSEKTKTDGQDLELSLHLPFATGLLSFIVPLWLPSARGVPLTMAFFISIVALIMVLTAAANRGHKE